jgi:hypothetical protein
MPTTPYPLAPQPEHGRFNRFLATLPPHDFSLLAPHLRTVALERGVMLHDVGEEMDNVYFPHTGMVSLVAVMQSGAIVETATIGRSGVIGASAGLGAWSTMARAIVQLPGTAAWIGAGQFRAAAAKPGHSRSQRALQRCFVCPRPTVSCVQCAPHVRGQALPVAAASARLRRWGYHPLNTGVSWSDARRAPNYRDTRGPAAAKRRPHPLPPRPNSNRRSQGARTYLLRMLRRHQPQC